MLVVWATFLVPLWNHLAQNTSPFGTRAETPRRTISTLQGHVWNLAVPIDRYKDKYIYIYREREREIDYDIYIYIYTDMYTYI